MLAMTPVVLARRQLHLRVPHPSTAVGPVGILVPYPAEVALNQELAQILLPQTAEPIVREALLRLAIHRHAHLPLQLFHSPPANTP